MNIIKPNEFVSSPPPTGLTLALPEGLSAAPLLERRKQILAAQPTLSILTAEKFAIDAELCQRWHDHPETRTNPQDGGKTEAELMAQQIASIDRSDNNL
jgi:hypothetical protein